MANQNWNVKKYSSDFSFVPAYGEELISLISHKEGKLIDIGCGSGALSERLLERGFLVTGLDDNAGFIASASSAYPSVRFIRGNIVSFTSDEKYSVAFSNAVLHWIDEKNQPKALKNIYNCLEKGGEFVFEMGGKGNCALIHSAAAEACADMGMEYKMPFYYPSEEAYSELLSGAGFKIEYSSLFNRPTPLKGEHGVRDWINMFLGGAVKSEEKRLKIGEAAEEKLKDKLFHNGKWYADYVRLRAKAIKDR